MDIPALEKLARLIRHHILVMTHGAGSGHPTTCFSAVDLATVLFFKHFTADLDDPESLANDRLIFSKGHAGALFYSLYAAAGKLLKEDLLGYRNFHSTLEGHPTKRFRYTEAATGSLGQGLAIGAGEAYAMKYFQGRLEYASLPQVFVIMGDGEMAEGSVWEAANFASHYRLNNLIAICDINRFGQSDETMHGHNVHAYEKKFKAFGWETVVVNGHNFLEIDAALDKAVHHEGGPFAVIAKTMKGKGIKTWENKDGWHNKMLSPEEYESGKKELGEIEENLVGVVAKPSPLRFVTKVDEKEEIKYYAGDQSSDIGLQSIDKQKSIEAPITLYKKDEKVATKKAFGNALARLGVEYSQLAVLDGDVKNSLHTDQFEKKFPQRFIQGYIAEQNLVGVATGLARQGILPLVATFSAFFSRAHDQIRMAPLSNVTILFNGSYGGVSIGKDGPSQMGLEDLGIFRALLNSTVLYPSDPYMTEKLVEQMVNVDGVVYIRTTREPTPVIYTENDRFEIGGSKIHISPTTNNQPPITIVSAGITVWEALKAQQQLAREGISTRVIDCYSIKPINASSLKEAARASKAIVTVEDHYAVGGLGDAVLEALAETSHPPVYKLAVTKTPRSGTPEELLAYEEIDTKAIVAKVKALL